MTITKQEFFACYQSALSNAMKWGCPHFTVHEWSEDLLLGWSQPSDSDSYEYLSHCKALWDYYESNIAG